MASHRPFSLNCPIQSPAFPLFWIGNLLEIFENSSTLQMSSNILEIFKNSSTLQMSSNISEIFKTSSTLQMSSPISRVLCQDSSPLFFRQLVVCQDNLSDCSLKPAFGRAPIVIASFRAQIKSKNIIIKKKPGKKSNLFF
jgi:hypothetical protein